MFDVNQFRTAIIRPALEPIHLYSEDAEELLVATCAQESMGGHFLCQQHGPAKGCYQMEPATHDSIWETTISTSMTLRTAIMERCNFNLKPLADVMVYDLRYATIMARCFWLRIHDKLPEMNDLNEIWLQYKLHWNTNAGAATKEQFFSNYTKFTGKK